MPVRVRLYLSGRVLERQPAGGHVLRYGVYNLNNQTGTHRVFNNQTGGATVQLCTGYDGVGCGEKMPTWTYWDVNLTPINSIKLAP